MKVTLPLRTTNPLNKREHWGPRARRNARERALGELATPATVKAPVTVLLTRLAPRLMDSDGSVASFKALRDGIADKLGVDDGSDKIAFKYAQRKSKQYGVEIEFTELRA